MVNVYEGYGDRFYSESEFPNIMKQLGEFELIGDDVLVPGGFSDGEVGRAMTWRRNEEVFVVKYETYTTAKVMGKRQVRKNSVDVYGSEGMINEFKHFLSGARSETKA